MGAYNFQPRFVPYVKDWSKRHTIRAERAHSDTCGSVMHLFTGLRHPGAELLMRTQCVRTDFIRITTKYRIFIGASVGLPEHPALYGEGQLHRGGFVELDQDERNALAWRDGFRPEGSVAINPGDCFRLMIQFWEQRGDNNSLRSGDFEGTMYHWDPAVQFSKNRNRLMRIAELHPLYVKGAAA